MAELAQNVCAQCGNPVPPGADACPFDGNTLFVTAGQVKESLAGMQLGEYVVKEPLGEGGMSDVYSGVQPVIGKRVAIKVLKPEMASDQSQVQRLMTEAISVNAIGHHNIIDIFGSGTLPDGRAYVVMEYLDGEGLDVYLNRLGPLPQLEVVELLIDICAPLAAAHAKGFIHRDLKPSNVFLVNQPDGTRFLKLLDFGLAKRSVSIDGNTRQTNVHRIAGTPDYMAPEQARAQDVSPATDLYSLGVLAFQLLSGRLPFIANTPMDVMMMQVSAPVPNLAELVKDLRPELEQLVNQLLAKDPATRPPSAEVVRAELKHIGMAMRTVGGVAHRVWTGEQPAVLLAAATPASSEGVTDSALPAVDNAPVEKPRTKLPLIIACAVAVLGASALFAWSMKAPAPTKVEPPPPPSAPLPVPQPIAVVKPKGPDPTELPPLVEYPRDVPKRPESMAELHKRVAGLEKRLHEVPAKARAQAKKILTREQKRLASTLSERDRREVEEALDAWESAYLRH